MKKRSYLFFIVPIFTLLILLFIPSTNVLVIQNRKDHTNEIISRKGYKEGFIISYTHSVNKGRVHDYYRTLKNTKELELYQTQFVSYGAGIPEPYETEGASFEVREDGYYITNLNRVLKSFAMAVGVIADHSIILGNKVCEEDEIYLTEYFLPQTSLIFSIKKISLFSLLTKDKI